MSPKISRMFPIYWVKFEHVSRYLGYIFWIDKSHRTYRFSVRFKKPPRIRDFVTLLKKSSLVKTKVSGTVYVLWIKFLWREIAPIFESFDCFRECFIRNRESKVHTRFRWKFTVLIWPINFINFSKRKICSHFINVWRRQLLKWRVDFVWLIYWHL